MPPFLIISAFLKCAIAKIGFEKNKVSYGFEALARAQCLLRSKMSLGKMALLSQVKLLFFFSGVCIGLHIQRSLFSWFSFWLRYSYLVEASATNFVENIDAVSR